VRHEMDGREILEISQEAVELGSADRGSFGAAKSAVWRGAIVSSQVSVPDIQIVRPVPQNP
jgi:hypothetical protein